MNALESVKSARLQLEVAQNRFNWATGDEVEIATLQLMAAEIFYNRAIRIAKEEGVVIEQGNFNWQAC